MKPWGVYVHVPWCRARCPYCAFDILPREAPDGSAWRAGVEADLRRWRSSYEGPPQSLYIGGGTPSRLKVRDLAAVIAQVGAPDVTLEANPEDLTAEWLDGVIAAGATRISLGVQSTLPRFARQLGRAHVPPEEAVRRLQDSPLESWSVDLIFGLPGQSLTDLQADLKAMLSWVPPHVSLYGLTIEPGTAYARLQERGRAMELTPELWRQMYDDLVLRLHAAGLQRYEVSNFARAGHRSVHNTLYWSGHPYLGAGPSAHGLTPDGRRWINPSYAQWQAGRAPEIERPTPKQAALDALLSGLRGVEGIPDAALGSYAVDPRTRRQLVENGLLVHHPNRLQLTDDGFPVSDAVVRSLANALHPTIG